jgi:hypothetical protein
MASFVGYSENKKFGGYEFSAPYKHKNLTVYFLKSAKAAKEKKFVTLAEAIKNKWLTVHETGNVQQLSVENLSDKTVFIQSGDIVRGGKQDRVLTVDLVVPPKSGKIGIDSFCVEQGRWQNRAGESVTAFNASSKKAFGRGLRNGYRSGVKGQNFVWQSVAVSQQSIGDNIKTNVNDEKSASSLQLTLENKKLKETAAAYIKVLKAGLEENKEACGFAFLVNNKFSNAEIFYNIPLFQDNAKALLEAAANEAITYLGEKVEKENNDWMPTFFNDNKGKEKMSEKSNMKYVENDFKDYYTIDNNFNGETVHRSIDIKDHEAIKKLQNSPLQQRGNLQQLNIDNLPQIQREEQQEEK